MTEAILILVIIAQIGLLGFVEWNNRKERKSMLNAILSKNTNEMVNLELADKTQIDVKKEKKNDMPDFTDVSGIPDDEYVDLITKKE